MQKFRSSSPGLDHGGPELQSLIEIDNAMADLRYIVLIQICACTVQIVLIILFMLCKNCIGLSYLMRGSSHVRSVRIGIEYRVQSKPIDKLVSYIPSSPLVTSPLINFR